MLHAAKRAYERGKGVVAMKVMGCGATPYVAHLPYVRSLCICMRSLEKVNKSLRYLADTDG